MQRLRLMQRFESDVLLKWRLRREMFRFKTSGFKLLPCESWEQEQEVLTITRFFIFTWQMQKSLTENRRLYKSICKADRPEL